MRDLGQIGTSCLLTFNTIYDYAAFLFYYRQEREVQDAMAKKPGDKKKATKKKGKK